VQLEIAGDGPQRESLAALARELGVSNRVTLLGWVPDMRPLLARWSLFANPSLEEGFGLAVVEAMAAGLPVVATPVGGLSEVIIDGENALLARPGHPEELASAINRLLRDPALAGRLGARAREHVERHFSIAQQVEATDVLYQSLLRDGGRRGRNATALV
jgi:glycosyltransferase involved in cell wall biosynthesis